MKNYCNLTVSLPSSEKITSSYVPATDKAQQRFNWSVYIQTNTKSAGANGVLYPDTILIPITAFGKTADIFQNSIASLPLNERKNMKLNISGKIVPGYYKVNEQNVRESINHLSIVVNEVEIVQIKYATENDDATGVKDVAYTNPAASYTNPAGGYTNPVGGYANPAGGYANPAGGYQQQINRPVPQPAGQQPIQPRTPVVGNNIGY